jgi:hypothetical protein
MNLERKQIYIKRERIYNLRDVNRRHFAAMMSKIPERQKFELMKEFLFFRNEILIEEFPAS